MKKNNLIAITGGIGSGKSLVLKTLKENGKQTLSCDLVTDEVYKKLFVRRRLAKMFPSAKSGKIIPHVNKKEIAKTVFSDKAKLKELTDFLTPIILKETLKKAKKLDGQVFVEVPLLFECNAQNEFDKVFVVKRNLEDRIQSVMERSKLSRKQVLERIQSQFDYDNADLSSYQIIQNDGNTAELVQKIKEFIS
ncbi:MAG: dephospho-CoA kinase [Clostridia bacterium]|nr:dephospho-CoA kinase [Clostridia bacterium]